jgi:hypothetical protein
MNTVEIWEALDGYWCARLVDPIIGPDWWTLTARSRGSVIAEMRCRLPRTHLEFRDRFRPAHY